MFLVRFITAALHGNARALRRPLSSSHPGLPWTPYQNAYDPALYYSLLLVWVGQICSLGVTD
jgi:hypothetical protein